ncbi:MAG: SprB repeat-containing protein, partial [Bacteroidetes bacterium]|nr:SprB repeat-containing protein [Bacteroidota bacterium]
MDDISCTATNIGFSAGSSNNWNFGAGSSPTTATGASINTQYSTLGRKNITYASNSYVGFANIILDSQVGPTFTTSAPFVQGQYRVCAGSSVIFTATNGGTGYIYNWNLGGGASPNTYTGTSFSSVSGTFNTPGVYTIELYYVTNCCGASITTTLDLYVEEQPNAVMPSDETICLGDNTGVPLTVTGGVTNGSISWYPSTGLNNTNQYSVVALPTTTTTYTVTLADSTGICTDVDDVTITVVDLVLTPSSSNVICNQDGTASVNVSGGSGSYSYLWSNGQTTSSITNLYAGTYQVLVTDLTLGCQDSIDVTVSPAPTAINGSMYQEDILCYGVGLGTAAISITGGTSPYTYDWSHLAPTSPTNNLSDTAYNLTAGTYTILVTDDNGCTFYDSVIITEPNPINIVIDSLLMPTCHENNDGYVEIRADGGTRPFTYSWSNGMAVTVINDEVIGTNMPADSLYLFVEDDNGCIDSLLVDLHVDSLYGTIDTTVCYNTNLTLPDGSNLTLVNDTNVIVTITNGSGCDSTITVNITVDEYTVENIDTTICQGQSLTVNGTTYNANGFYQDTARYVISGCDSIQYNINL